MHINFKKLPKFPPFLAQASLFAATTVLVLVLITRFIAPITLEAHQTITPRSATFIGTSTVTTSPDKVEIVLGISRKEADVKTAQNKANEIITTLQQKMAELGVSKDDIKTQNYSIYPNYNYQKATQDIVGYSADISLQIQLKDSSKLGQVIDAATAAGVNQVSGIQFTISEEKQRELRAQARAQAVEDAKKNGQDLAKLAGMKLGNIVNITEDSVTPDGPRPLYEKSSGGGAGVGGSPTNVEPGTTKYTYTVTVTYETK